MLLTRMENMRWRRPVIYGLGLYFLASGLDCFRIGSIGSLLKLIAAVPLGLSLLNIRNWRMRFTPTIGVLLCFWMLSAGSILYSVGHYRSWLSVSSLSMNLVMVFCLGCMEDYTAEELRFLKGALVAGGWITVALTFLFADYSIGGRLTIMMGNEDADQNYLNGYYLYAFSWHICRLLDGKKRHILPVAVLMTVVLMTGSRGGAVAFLAVLLIQVAIYFAHSPDKLRTFLLMVLGLLLVVVLFELMLMLIPAEVALRFSPEYLEEKGTTSRVDMWLHLLDHYSTDSLPRMIFGHGYGTCPLVNSFNGKIAHNIYVDNLITVGLLGLLLQLCIQGSVVMLLSRHQERPMLGAQWGMICLNMSLSLVAFKPMWNIVLMTVAIDKTAKRERELVQGPQRYEMEEQGDYSMNMKNEKQGYSISMPQLYALLKRYLALILAAGFACGVIAWCTCSFFVDPVYEASAKMIVNSRQEQTGNMTNDQITSAQKLVDTYAIIIRSRPVMDLVIDNLELPMSVEQLAERVSITPVNKTQVMRISIQSTDPEQALRIVEQIVSICPPIIIDAVEAGSVKTVEPAYLTKEPVAPSTNLITLVSAVLGMALVAAVVLGRFLLDNTYKSEMDLRNDLGLPVLGVIPDYESCIRQRKEGKERSYYGKA